MKNINCPAFPFQDPDASHLIQDSATGDWVVIAPGRRYRPDGMQKKKVKDPLSPRYLSKEELLATYGRGENVIRAVLNAFPIFRPDHSVGGKQEILVEGNRIMSFWDSTVDRIESLFAAFQKRFVILKKDSSIKYIQAFKNEGLQAGSSQPHPHSQIFALSFVPEHIRDMAKRRRSFRKFGFSLHDRAMQEATVERMIYSDRSIVAFANPAARFAYEVRIIPRVRRDSIVELTRGERRSMAKALHSLLPLMKTNALAYNFYFHDVKDEKDEHFEIRFVPRMNTWGGFELDAGIVVNPVPAECAAHEYRVAIK